MVVAFFLPGFPKHFIKFIYLPKMEYRSIHCNCELYMVREFENGFLKTCISLKTKPI